MTVAYASARNLTSVDTPAPTLPLSGVVTTPWTRPSGWLALPTLTAADEKIVGLVAVSSDANFIAILVTGAVGYTVNWGDGTIENFAPNVQANHQYVYSNVNIGGNYIARNYKQAIVTITPQAGGSITAVNLGVKNSTTGLGKYVTPWLDMNISLPNCTLANLVICGAAAPTFISMLERVNIVKLNNYNNNGGSQFWAASALQNVTWPAGAVFAGGQSYMYYNCSALQSVPDIDLSQASSTTSMFSGCYSLVVPPVINTTTALISCDGMFNGCSSLQTAPFFNTINISTTNTLFAGCNSLINVPLYDTRNVTIFSSMFSGCSKLQIVPFLNTIKGTTFTGMFTGCSKITSVPLFNTVAATAMGSMFSSCVSLTSVPLFNTALVTTMDSMFSGCTSLTSVPSFNTVSVTLMGSMFSGCTSLTAVPLFNTALVISMASMFLNNKSLVAIPSFNTANNTSTVSMFQGCLKLQSVPALNCIKVTSTVNMYYGCVSLEFGPYLGFGAALTTTATMYSGCINLQQDPGFAGPTINWLVCTSMFTGCTSLIASDNTDFSSCTTNTTVFNGCTNLSKASSTTFKRTVSFASCKLSATALDDIFTLLPTVTAQTITITGNYGTTGCTRTIATAKGWTVTG
jgi:surface protein